MFIINHKNQILRKVKANLTCRKANLVEKGKTIAPAIVFLFWCT